jgi:hypothetical protein
MDGEFLRQWLPIGIAIAVFIWNVRLHFAGARKEELTRLGERIDAVAGELGAHKEAGQTSRSDLATRLGQVEVTLAQLPSKDLVHELSLGQSDMRGDIKEIVARLTAVAETSRRVENFLLEGAKPK